MLMMMMLIYNSWYAVDK